MNFLYGIVLFLWDYVDWLFLVLNEFVGMFLGDMECYDIVRISKYDSNLIMMFWFLMVGLVIWFFINVFGVVFSFVFEDSMEFVCCKMGLLL